MRYHRLHREQWIPRPLEQVFPFFERPENLGLITPPWLRFEILSPSPIALTTGGFIDYRIRLKGWPVRWRTRIAGYTPPQEFTDEQFSGPYACWRHRHGFQAAGDGTRLTDRVHYALPAWLPAILEHRLHRHFVAPALKDIFDYRASVIRRMFGAEPRPRGDEPS